MSPPCPRSYPRHKNCCCLTSAWIWMHVIFLERDSLWWPLVAARLVDSGSQAPEVSHSKRWCLPILQKARPRILFQISSGVVFLSPWTRFASTCLIYLVTSTVSQKAFLTSLRKKEHNLLLPIKGGRSGVQRDWSVFNSSMGYMCRRREQARWQNRSRMRGIVVCRGYCGCWRRYRCFSSDDFSLCDCWTSEREATFGRK